MKQLPPAKDRMIHFEDQWGEFDFLLTPQKSHAHMFFHLRKRYKAGGNESMIDGWIDRATVTKIRDQLNAWLESQK